MRSSRTAHPIGTDIGQQTLRQFITRGLELFVVQVAHHEFAVELSHLIAVYGGIGLGRMVGSIGLLRCHACALLRAAPQRYAQNDHHHSHHGHGDINKSECGVHINLSTVAWRARAHRPS